MTKHTITRVWIVGFSVFVAGLILGFVFLGLMLGLGGHWVATGVANNYNFEPTFNAYFWTMLTLMIVSFIGSLAGGVVQLVAWIGALLNTYQIEDKTWFAVLLGGGLLGLAFGLIGLAAMVAYLIAGPDGTAKREPESLAPPQWPSTMAPTG
jgi:hypothetical protein